MSADVMEDQPAHKKQKLAQSASFEDDLDGFSELNRLEPINESQSHASSMSMPNGSMMNGNAPMQMASQSHPQQSQMPPHSHPYHSASNNQQQQPPSQQQQPVMQQQAQSSVLQELLLSNSHSSSSSMNSPRTSYMSRSPMTSNVVVQNMTPSTQTMGMQPHMAQQQQRVMQQHGQMRHSNVGANGSMMPQGHVFDGNMTQNTAGSGMTSHASNATGNYQAAMMSQQPPHVGYNSYAHPQASQQQQMHVRPAYGQTGTTVRGGPGPPHAPPGAAGGNAGPPTMPRNNNMMVNGGPAPGAPRGVRQAIMMNSGPQQQSRSMMIMNQNGPVGGGSGGIGGQQGMQYEQGSFSMNNGHVQGSGMPGPQRQGSLSDSYPQMQPGSNQPNQAGQVFPPHMQGSSQQPQGFGQVNPNGSINSQMPLSSHRSNFVGMPPSSISNQMMSSHVMDNTMINSQTGQPSAGGHPQQPVPGMMMNGPPHMGGPPGGVQKGMMPQNAASTMGGGGASQVAPSPSHITQTVPQQPQQSMIGVGAQQPHSQQQTSMMNGPMRPQSTGFGGGAGTTATQTQDPEKRKLIQQQLVLLLHAHKCQQREKQDPQNKSQCTVPYCQTMKSVLDHMTNCTMGRSCVYAHCASSRQIITHWKNCNKDDCPVCKPVKTFNVNNANERRPDLLLNQSLPGSSLGGGGSILGASTSSGAPHSISTSIGSVGPPSVSLFGSPSSNATTMNVNNLLIDFNPNPSNTNPFRSNNPPNKVGQPNAVAMPMIQNDGFGAFPPPDPPNQLKEWHASITQDLRNHLVGKLVKAIFPSPDPAAIHDQRIKDLISYARKVEKEMFEMAGDKEEYYHLLAEKIYKIQKELQEKKNRRLNEQQNNNGGRLLESDGFAPPPIRPPGTMHQQQFAQQQQAMSDNNGAVGGAMAPLVASSSTLSLMSIPSNSSTVGDFSSTLTSSMVKDVKLEPSIMQQAGSMPSSSMNNANTNSSTSTASTSASTFAQASSTTASNGNNRSMILEDTKSGISLSSVKSEVDRPIKSEIDCSIGENTTNSERTMIVAKRSTSPCRESNSGGTSSSQVHPKEEELPVEEKIFEAKELEDYVMPVLNKLVDAEESMPFRLPVDPELLKIPDYFTIIKRPMDLYTIRKKLEEGKYKNPWEFCDDVYLMFENAWLYNRKNSKVYKFCTKLSEIFIEEINPVMRQMGYCCGQKLAFTPLALFCYGQSSCVIARDQSYYLYEPGPNPYGVVVNDRLIYCTKCFEALPEEGVNLSENPNEQPNMAPKSGFKLLKNDNIDPEPFENCKVCQRRWHRICANYSRKIYPEGFICDSCRAEKNKPKPENRFTAKKLPHCNLSRHIENRVNGFIERKEPGSKDKYEVVIRVLCSTDKEVEVKPLMKQKYVPQGFPEKFPYRTKAVFAFEVVDGVEVCFFGLHVQEYGSNCLAPNLRRVYIAYLDSVYFFQPKHIRTDVYHEILLGYLEYVKNLGYTMAHIWACPPSEGDDYIFHCHPPEQKIPKPKRLQDWYKKMLDKGRDMGTVYEYKDIYKQAKDDDLTTPMALPYFEGDFWPNVIEDCIRDAEKEENERKKHEEALIEDDEEDIFQSDVKKNNKSSNSKKKNNLKKSSQKSKKKGGAGTGNQVTDKLFNVLEKHKEVFFTIRLVQPQAEMLANNKQIVDPDPLIASELMDGRDTFLNRAREEHWEFSSLRRAKYSTMNFCYALHTQEQDNKDMSYTCNRCNNGASYHCPQCDDFDLCSRCYNPDSHPHKMDKLLIEVETKTNDSSTTDRNESVKRCINSLVHSCQCRDANCRRLTCHKMKKVVQHTKVCKKRQQTSCPVCKQLIALCCYHAKHCTLTACPVPFCSNIRQKLQEQKRSQARRADMMMRRRMEKLQSVNVSSQQSSQGGASQGGGGGMSSQQGTPGMMAVSSTSAQHMTIHNTGLMAPHQQQMGIGMTNGPGGMSMQNQSHMMSGNQMMHNAGNGMMNAMHSNMPSQQQQHYQQQQHPMGMGGQQPGMSGMLQQHQQQPHMRNNPMMQGGPHQMAITPQQQQQHRMMQQQQQQQGGGQINPPPYGRGGPPGGGAGGQPSMVNSPIAYNTNNSAQPMGGGKPGSMGPSGGGGGGIRLTQQQQQQMQQQQQQRRPPHQSQPSPSDAQQSQQQQPQSQQQFSNQMRNSDSQLKHIVARLKATQNPEERRNVFTDLKKTPHLFAAFLKMSKNENNQSGCGQTSSAQDPMMQQQMRQQNWIPSQQQAQQYQGGPQPPLSQGGVVGRGGGGPSSGGGGGSGVNGGTPYNTQWGGQQQPPPSQSQQYPQQ